MNNPNGLPISRLNELPDVDASAPDDGQSLVWDATAGAWKPADRLAPDGDGSQLTGITQSQVPGLTAALNAKAPLASPSLTGTPTAPTAATGTSTTQVATTAFVAVVDASAVHKSGAETIAGTKTFSNRPTFSSGVTCPMGAAALNNEALGSAALISITTGGNNVAAGSSAAQSLTTTNNCVAVGRGALSAMTTAGDSCTAVGYFADGLKTTGSSCTAVGASTSTGTFTGSTALGAGATATASNQVRLGTASETVSIPGKASVAGWFQIGTSTDAAIPNGGIAWSLTNPDTLKVRTPSGTLKVVTLT